VRRSYGKMAIYGFAVLVLIFLVLPTLIVIPMSFSSARYLEFPPPGFSLRWYENFFNTPSWVDSFTYSIKVGLCAAILAAVFGVMASIVLARVKSKWVDAIYYVTMTPMIVPLVIIAVSLYSAYIQMKLQGTFIGLVIAHTVIAIPYVITTVSGSLRVFDIRIEQAAISLGAHPLKAFMKITVPIISPSLLSGALFAFITSFDELIVSIYVSGVTSKTLPVRMWEGIRIEIDPTITAISAILIMITVAFFVCMQIFQAMSRKRGLSQ